MREWVLLHPVSSDIDAARDPDFVMCEGVVEETLKARSTSRAAGNAIVQGQRQHFGLASLPFAVEHVESVPQVREEVVRGGEAAVLVVTVVVGLL